MLKEISIPFADLRRVSVECGDCRTVMIFDLEGQLDVTHCPACHRDFDPGVKESLVSLGRLYVRLRESRHAFAFRVPAGE